MLTDGATQKDAKRKPPFLNQRLPAFSLLTVLWRPPGLPGRLTGMTEAFLRLTSVPGASVGALPNKLPAVFCNGDGGR